MRGLLLAVLPIAALDTVRVDAQNVGFAPPGWQWSLDRTAGTTADSSRLDRMPPGWHITTGPAGLLYPSAGRASGAFTLVTDFVVFPMTTESGFGVFLEGSHAVDPSRRDQAAPGIGHGDEPAAIERIGRFAARVRE